jgi:hypothetical protein
LIRTGGAGEGDISDNPIAQPGTIGKLHFCVNEAGNPSMVSALSAVLTAAVPTNKHWGDLIPGREWNAAGHFSHFHR